jgi:Acyclic terpene utilisation family protein AtuA
MSRMVAGGAVDVITGDWLSEMNIAWNAIAKAADPDLGYEAGFLTQLESCVDDVAAKGLKVITNAGALNTEALKKKVQEMCVERGQGGLVVASVVGDDISHLLKGKGREESKKQFRHLDHWECPLGGWELANNVTSAVAYIGAWGIVAALNAGADIIICGRVTDASPVVGAATWWYGWKEDSFDQLAGALIASREFLSCPSTCEEQKLTILKTSLNVDLMQQEPTFLASEAIFRNS